VDFASFEARVVIEVDGGQHAVEKEKDEERDTWLRSHGFKVLRFWNHEVLENTDGVMETIRRELTTPSPNPSRQGRGVLNLGHEYPKLS
jgi:very-short-patch-repair endonuclease